jgi:LuxR family transcriptional regulator, regulator of acetate metabolism
MSATMSLLSQSETATDALLRDSLSELARRTDFPLVFGGFAEHQNVILSRLLGNHGSSLSGLIVHAGAGLGGRALLERRIRLTTEYGSSRVITHDYDRPVLAEGITTLLAVPVIAGGSVRAILYGGLRDGGGIGGISIEPALAVARSMAARLEPRPQNPSAAQRAACPPAPVTSLSGSQMEDLRSLYAEIRSIGARVADAVLRERLQELERRIASIAHGDVSGVPEEWARTLLTAREADVLSLAALGRTNADIGHTIGVTVSTVKSYMNSAMRKLASTTRFEAVATARRLRLLP